MDMPSTETSEMDLTPCLSVIPALANRMVGLPIEEVTSECRRRTYRVCE